MHMRLKIFTLRYFDVFKDQRIFNSLKFGYFLTCLVLWRAHTV